jgi:uncharacterized protein YggE
MNKVIVMILVLICQILYGQQSEQKINQISVQGSVELKEMADQAILCFTVKGVGVSLRQAVENADRNTKVITDKLIVLGVKEKNISTSSFYSGENYGDKAFLSSNRDYQANITTIIKVDSLKLLQYVLFAISESDVKNLSQITFSLKDEVSFRRRARIEAALKAKEKAEDMTKALNITLGKVISIDEVQPTQSIQTPYMMRGVRANPFNPVSFNTVVGVQAGVVDESIGTGFFAQTISITSQVYVTFEIK